MDRSKVSVGAEVLFDAAGSGQAGLDEFVTWLEETYPKIQVFRSVGDEREERLTLVFKQEE